ncbi:hypothetical protein QJS66_09465 [Kocuria rhizophila]|nr:hypothetical protein QJS66_09465 [Kocuria rhizophila]
MVTSEERQAMLGRHARTPGCARTLASGAARRSTTPRRGARAVMVPPSSPPGSPFLHDGRTPDGPTSLAGRPDASAPPRQRHPDRNAGSSRRTRASCTCPWCSRWSTTTRRPTWTILAGVVVIAAALDPPDAHGAQGPPRVRDGEYASQRGHYDGAGAGVPAPAGAEDAEDGVGVPRCACSTSRAHARELLRHLPEYAVARAAAVRRRAVRELGHGRLPRRHPGLAGVPPAAPAPGSEHGMAPTRRRWPCRSSSPREASEPARSPARARQ